MNLRDKNQHDSITIIMLLYSILCSICVFWGMWEAGKWLISLTKEVIK